MKGCTKSKVSKLVMFSTGPATLVPPQDDVTEQNVFVKFPPISCLQKINEMEEAETGQKTRVDKKSVKRIVERLAKRGHIKSVKTLIKYGKTQKEVCIVELLCLENDDDAAASPSLSC